MPKSLAAPLRGLLGAACASLCAPVMASAQAYPKVLGPGGTYIPANPAAIYIPSCNGGAGGFVGMTYSGQLCAEPGASAAQQTYVLASAQTLTAGSASIPQTLTTSATYGWSYILSGTSPSVALQVLGPDGTTWQTVGSPVTATGMQGVVIFAGAAGASVRLYNAGTNPVTITSKLVS